MKKFLLSISFLYDSRVFHVSNQTVIYIFSAFCNHLFYTCIFVRILYIFLFPFFFGSCYLNGSGDSVQFGPAIQYTRMILRIDNTERTGKMQNLHGRDRPEGNTILC